MPRHLLKMHDFVTIKSGDVVKKLKQTDSAVPSSLLVRVAATHAGIINGNMRFYRPDRMMDSTHTWLPKKGEFARPILVGHNDEGSVVGRVVDAKYIDESYKYRKNGTLSDSVFYATDGKRKNDLFKTVDWIVENLMDLEEYRGLGFVELGLKVTNPEAVARVMRDEFLTVSVGFKTDSAICSICHTDWAVDDRCAHKMGETVDGKQMFLIAGAMDFEEVSFVNFPADPFAGVVSKEKLADGLARMKPFFLGLPVRQQAAMSSTSGLMLTDSLYDADISIVEVTMAEENKNSTATTEQDELQAALENPAPGCVVDDEDCAPKLEDICAEDRAFFDDEDGLYEEITIEIVAAQVAGEIPTGDAKLSTEKRKGLKSGTFCGPNRSFPVPDCAHVTAARRLIGRAKVSEDTKKKILACVSRKASSLGCGGKKDAVTPPAATTPAFSDSLKAVLETVKFTDAGKPLVDLLDSLDKSYGDAEDNEKGLLRAALYALLDRWSSDSALAYYKQQLSEKDFVVTAKADADKAAQEAKDNLERLALEKKDASDQREQNKALLVVYKRSLASQIVLAKAAQGAEGFKGLDAEQAKAKVDELAKRHVTSLKDTVADLLSELKVIPAAATPDPKPAEAAVVAVTDNAQVTEPVAPPVEDKDVEAKVADAKRLRDYKISMMTDNERRRFLAEESLAQAKTAKK
jgi:hypothetical protein